MKATREEILKLIHKAQKLKSNRIKESTIGSPENDKKISVYFLYLEKHNIYDTFKNSDVFFNKTTKIKYTEF